MTQIMVEISDKAIDNTLKKHIKSLEAKIKKLETKNKELINRIKKRNFKIEEAERIVSIASNISAEFGNGWGQQW